MKQRLSKNKLYHDVIVAENTSITKEWTDIDLTDIATTERDVQMVGLKLSEPFSINFDLGEIQSGTGKVLHPEIRLESEKGELYPLYFANGRGNRLASYRPETPFVEGTIFKRVQVRCDIPFNVDRVIWTTYNKR